MHLRSSIMTKYIFLPFLFTLLWCQAVFTQKEEHCLILSDFAGELNNFEYSKGKCWKIQVPQNSFVNFTPLYIPHCESSHFIIRDLKTEKSYRICEPEFLDNHVIAFNEVIIELNFWGEFYMKTNINYIIQNIECLDYTSFRCSPYFCISSYQICDGVDDCENGEDESECGIRAIKGVKEARESAISWLKSKYTSSRGWGDNTARAVVALQLASGVNFNGFDLEGKLMAKQTELKTAVGFLKSSQSNNELSMTLNSLLVTCHNPRRFYGIDLVKQLKTQVQLTTNFTHPIVYLALCNANESWPYKADEDLANILTSYSSYHFAKDIQAMAVMALSCEMNHRSQYRSSRNSTLLELYHDKIQQFIELQQKDGSFGNVYTTALIAQSLVSYGYEISTNITKLNINATIKYLISHLNSSSVDFLSTYMTLPLLNGKTLVDIGKVNCSENPRKHGEDPVADVNDYIGPKTRVQYSLYIGDNKEIIHSISLLVPANYTALEVMELAEAEDPKYRFQREVMGNTYVYEIAGITNDPEFGKFWLLYYSAGNEVLAHLTTSLEDLTVSDDSRLVMWYKTASI